MKKLLIALTTTGVVMFGSAVQAAGNATAGQATYSSSCIGCHGAAAEGGVGPKLAGLSDKDIIAKLHDYKSGKQMGPMTSLMAPMAQGLSNSDIDNIAAYVSTL